MSEPEHCQNEKREEEKLSFFVDLSPEKKTQVGTHMRTKGKVLSLVIRSPDKFQAGYLLRGIY